MRSKILIVALAGAVLAGTTGFRLVHVPSASAQEEDSDDQPIELSAVPQAAQDAVRKVVGTLDGCKASTEEERGAKLFEIDFPSSKTSVKVTADGHLVEVERQVDQGMLPAGALAALQQRFPGAKIAGVEEVESHHFGVLLSMDGKRREVELAPTGKLMGRHEGSEEEEDDDD